jgi:hypothetical protein
MPFPLQFVLSAVDLLAELPNSASRSLNKRLPSTAVSLASACFTRRPQFVLTTAPNKLGAELRGEKCCITKSILTYAKPSYPVAGRVVADLKASLNAIFYDSLSSQHGLEYIPLVARYTLPGRTGPLKTKEMIYHFSAIARSSQSRRPSLCLCLRDVAKLSLAAHGTPRR